MVIEPSLGKFAGLLGIIVLLENDIIWCFIIKLQRLLQFILQDGAASICPILVAYPMSSQNIQPHIITLPPPNFSIPSTYLSVNPSPTSFHTHFLPSDPIQLILVSSDHTTLLQSAIVYSLCLSVHSSLARL